MPATKFTALQLGSSKAIVKVNYIFNFIVHTSSGSLRATENIKPVSVTFSNQIRSCQFFLFQKLSSNGFQKENLWHATITHNNLFKLTIALIDKFGKQFATIKTKTRKASKNLLT